VLVVLTVLVLVLVLVPMLLEVMLMAELPMQQRTRWLRSGILSQQDYQTLGIFESCGCWMSM
jgi:hypothetical protein